MCGGRLRSLIQATSTLGAALLLFSAGFPPLEDAAEVDLTLHMLQHVMIVISGILIAYPLFRKRLSRGEGGGVIPKLALLGASSLIVFWHVPAEWDLAVLNPGVHVVEHLSFLLVGLLAGSWILLLSDTYKIGGLLVAFFGHMAYAVALISPWNQQIYPLFSVADQMVLGWVLILTGPFFLVGVGYVLARNPNWLGGLTSAGVQPRRKETALNRAKPPAWAVPVLTIALLGALVVYFAVATVAVTASSPGKISRGAIVYINETPITWQYSPQSITVVLGVNNTVTWVSHSIAYDTVTDRAGSFRSGSIAPGQTYTYTFLKPGVYSYYCTYHPWMVGTVIVIS